MRTGLRQLVFMLAIAGGSVSAAEFPHEKVLVRLFRIALTGPTTYKIARYSYGDGGNGPSAESQEAWCSDACLSSPEGTPSPEYLKRVAEANKILDKIARQLVASGLKGNEFNTALQEHLEEIYHKQKVYNLLSAEIDNQQEGSCIPTCVAFSLHAPTTAGVEAPWKQIVTACTAREERLDLHVVVHAGANAALPEVYHRAAQLLVQNAKFFTCLRQVVDRVPEVRDRVVKLYMGTPDEELRQSRILAWDLWEKAGIPRIIDLAAQEPPDIAGIEKLLDACISEPPPS